MLKNLIRKVKGLFYALPFAMKAGDELLTASNNESNDGTGIVQKKQAKSVWESLIQGEVTQEVEELRYATYKAEEESMNYTYVGNGQAIKNNENDDIKRKNRLHFIQPNIVTEYGTNETLSMINLSGDVVDKKYVYVKERYLINIKHKNPNARFQFSSYMDKAQILIGEGGYYTELYIPIIKGDGKRRPLINVLKSIYNELNSGVKFNNSYKEHHEIVDDLLELKFTTYKASNNVPNGIDYEFKKGSCISIKENDEYMMLRFKWNEFNGGKLLSEKYYSETQDRKYKNKEKKENYNPTIIL